MSSFFNLPPPWNPGYALPRNVEAEGLVRGTFTARQAPRGTYDDPVVGRGGYQVPAYAIDEGYGQGAVVTAWMPRGEAPRVQHWLDMPTTIVEGATPVRGGGTEYHLDVLSGDPAPAALPLPGQKGDPFVLYGRRAARIIARKMKGLPPGDRRVALKAIFDTVDPALWGKVAQRAETYLAAGQSADAAFEQAMATAFADGMLSEIIATGTKRTAPEPASLMGLGCYGCGGVLGDVATAAQAASSSGTAPAPTVNEVIEIGPFSFPAESSVVPTISWRKSLLPASWKEWLIKEERRLTNIAIGKAMSGERWAKTVRWAKASSLGLDQWIGLPPNDDVYVRFFNGEKPIMKVKHPKNGRDYGVYLISKPGLLNIQFKEVPPAQRSWLGKIWDAIASIPANLKKLAVKAYEAAKDVVTALGDVACDLLNTPGSDIAAAAGAAAAGAPPQAGMQGAQVGRAICNSGKKETAPAPPPPPKPAIGAGTVLAIAGAAGAALYFGLK